MFTTRFIFVGDPLFPKAGGNRPFFQEGTSKGGNPYFKMNLGIKATETNIGWVECFDSKKDTIMFTINKEKCEFAWEDRLSKSVIAKVPAQMRYTVNLGDDHGGLQEFITGTDFMEYLSETLPDYEGRIQVSGTVQISYYKEKYYKHYQMNRVVAAKDEVANGLNILADLYYNKESLDKADWKTENKLYLNSYVEQYISKEEGHKYMPVNLVFNMPNMEDQDRAEKISNLIMKYLSPKKGYAHLLWSCSAMNGSDQLDFTEDMLTPQQKEMLDMGLSTLEEMRPYNKVMGDLVSEWRLVKPDLRDRGESIGNFTEGFIACEETDEEFEERIYVPPVGYETLDDVIEDKGTKKETKAEPKKAKSTANLDPIDLFEDLI